MIRFIRIRFALPNILVWAAMVTFLTFPPLASSSWSIPSLPNQTCAEECVAAFPSSNSQQQISFCGSGQVSYNTTATAVPCLFQCGVGVLYPGMCECPNECGPNGNCTTNSNGTYECICPSGWGGKDCSSVECPSNRCGGHGNCIPSSGVYADFCQCDEGYTGIDCTQALLAVGDLPWGCILPPVFHAPGHGNCTPVPLEQMPWFRFNEIPVTRLTMSMSDYEAIVAPSNSDASDYYPATFSLEGTTVSQQFESIGVHLHGAGSRTHVKKSFSLKFDKYNKTDPVAKQWSKFALKAAESPVGYQLMISLLMTAGQPAQRTMYTVVFVNDIFFGLYMILPDFTEGWMEAWYPNTSGNFYKGGFHCWYQFDPTGLYDCAENVFSDSTNRTDLQTMANFTNFASDAEFEAMVGTYFDMEGLYRQEMLASFMQLRDGMTDSANNYQVYAMNRHGVSSVELDAPTTVLPRSVAAPPPPWLYTMSTRDFDQVFKMITGTDGWMNANVLEFPFVAINRSILSHELWKRSPLLDRAFNMSTVMGSYVQQYKSFLAALTTPHQPSATPNISSWFLAVAMFIEPFCGKGFDVAWINPYNVTVDLRDRPALLQQRIRDVVAELESYPTTPIVGGSPPSACPLGSCAVFASTVVAPAIVVIAIVAVLVLIRSRRRRRAAYSEGLTNDYMSTH